MSDPIRIDMGRPVVMRPPRSREEVSDESWERLRQWNEEMRKPKMKTPISDFVDSLIALLRKKGG